MVLLTPILLFPLLEKKGDGIHLPIYIITKPPSHHTNPFHPLYGNHPPPSSVEEGGEVERRKGEEREGRRGWEEGSVVNIYCPNQLVR